MTAIPQTFNGKPLRHAWPYRSPVGDVTGIVGRYQLNGAGPKDCVPFFIRDGSGWKAGAGTEPRPLFGLEFVHADTERKAVLIVEGEKCAAAVQSLGVCCVTSPGGSKSADRSDWKPVSGFAKAYVLPDNDEPGQAYARAVYAALSALDKPPAVSVVPLPGLRDKGDICDWLQARCDGWDGFLPLPKSEHERLLAEFRQAVKAHAVPFAEWEGAASSAPVDDWEAPISIDESPLPPWPAGVFAESVGEFVDGLATATETPIELPALFVMATLSAAIGGKYQVNVKPDYREPVHIWACPALVPGSRKTAVKVACTAPLVKWEREQRQAMEVDIKAAESERKTALDRVAALRKRAAGAKGFEYETLKKEVADLEANLPDIPRPPQVFADDVTPERLGTLLADNNERLAILSDEAGIFEQMAGRYSGGIPNLDVFLQGHAGSPVRVDRGSRPSVFLLRPALSIGISPQPDVLRGLTAKPGFRGRGLLARFLYALPEPNLGKRTNATRPLSEDRRLRWEGRITALLNAPMATDDQGQPCPHTLTLSPEARTAWDAFWLRVEGQMGPGGRFESMTDWAGKVPGGVARIAGLLHIARHAFRGPHTLEISQEDMSHAIRVGDCLSAHAVKVFGMMGGSGVLDDARHVLGWIRAEGLQSFTFRDCHRRHQGRFPLAEELAPVLDVLTERHYIRPVRTPPGPKGGRPSRAYEVSPHI